MAPGHWYIGDATPPTLLHRGCVAVYEKDTKSQAQQQGTIVDVSRARQSSAPERWETQPGARSQVLKIADIISSVEGRCEWLEGRPTALTQKLIQNQRTFLE